MAKVETKKLEQIDLALLNKCEFFLGDRIVQFSWNKEFSIELSLIREKEQEKVLINYLHGRKIINKILLLKTKCYFGGFRYWFECPIYRNKKLCKRRIRILYRKDDSWGCRRCHNLTYSSQNLSGIDKISGVLIDPSKIRVTHYKGIVTKRYQAYLRKQKNVNKANEAQLLKLGKKAERLEKRYGLKYFC